LSESLVVILLLNLTPVESGDRILKSVLTGGLEGNSHPAKKQEAAQKKNVST